MSQVMNKIKVFEKELAYIRNPKIAQYASMAVESMPDYFFVIPASSTGKYHPNYALGQGGLVRHVKAGVMLLIEMFRVGWYQDIPEDDKDLLITAFILHDGWKSGVHLQTYTVQDHPVIAVNELKGNALLRSIITEEQENIILSVISSHMGYWNFDRRSGKEFAPRPITEYQKLIHIVDYVASRKMFEVNFDVATER